MTYDMPAVLDPTGVPVTGGPPINLSALKVGHDLIR